MTAPQPGRSTDPKATAALIAAQAAAIATIRARISGFIQLTWRGLPDYRTASVGKFTTAVLPVVAAGQRQVAATTDAYLSQMYAQMTGQPVRMVGVATSATSDLRGVDPAEVYARPFHLVWRDLAAAQKQRDAYYEWTKPTDDLPTRPPLPPVDYVDKAIKSGLDRAVNLATTDLQLAKTHASQQVLDKQEHVVGYRRVLEGVYSCGLCVVASTQRYHRSNLLPIHPACDCSVAPIVGDQDPGHIINAPLLANAHDAIADTFGRDSSAAKYIPKAYGDQGLPIQYKDVLITHDHGELGPVLAVRGQNFTGPSDIDVPKHVTPTSDATASAAA